MEMLHSNTHHAVGDSAAVRRRGATDGDPASTSYDESLRSALSELLQSSSVKLEADHADLLVDALLSPRNELQAERADKRPPKPATKFDAEIKYLYGPDEKGESDDSADTTLTEADMADAGGDYAEGNEDLPLGGGGHDTAYGNQRAIPQRIPSRPIARGRDDLQIGGGNGDVCRLRADNSPSSFMTRSLRARLGNDLSEHLNSKWLSRHPDVADVLDGHPELVDIMTELLGERESLQQALQQTQEEMNRRRLENLQHAQYLEELSADQIEKARHEYEVARQAEVLQHVAVEIAPDDIVEKMARELREKEEQMQKMLEQQNKLKEELAAKDQLHSERSHQYDESQKKLNQELAGLKSQLSEAKTRSLQRRKRYGGTTSRPSSLLLEQLSHLAVEKSDEAEKLREELLAMQKREQDRADMEQYMPHNGKHGSDSLTSSMTSSETGSMLYHYGMDSKELSGSYIPGSLSRTPLQTTSPPPMSGGEEEVASVVDRFLMSNTNESLAQHANLTVTRRPSRDRPQSPLATSMSQDDNRVDGRFSPAHDPLITPMVMLPDNNVENDVEQQPESGERTPLQEMGTGFSDEGMNSPCVAFPEGTRRNSVSNSRSARLGPAVVPDLSSFLGIRSSKHKSLSHSTLPLSNSLDIVVIKSSRSRSCPKLDCILEKDSESKDTDSESEGRNDRLAMTRSCSAVDTMAVKRYLLKSDSDFSDSDVVKDIRSFSTDAKQRLGIFKAQSLAAAEASASWQPVTSMSGFSTPTPAPTPTPRSPAQDGSGLAARSKHDRRWQRSSNEPQVFNVAVMGPSGVGKTSFVKDFARGDAANSAEGYKRPTTTVGLDFVVCSSKICGVDVTLKLWDTAGAERYLSMTRTYLRRCDGVILMFDVADRSSFHKIKTWYGEVMNTCSEGIPILVAGNKVDRAKDLPSEDVIGMAEATDMAQKLNSAMYMEVCAIQGYGVCEACSIMTTAMLAKRFHQEREQQHTDILLDDEEDKGCCF